jgi:hypothetical protein
VRAPQKAPAISRGRRLLGSGGEAILGSGAEAIR